ncbi:MAG: DUF4838 domain-containing protein [Kiritimatiellae bacterium]|nr:DUF4838 domain-containing protein [Kiritimatiellia bacterium]
MKAVLLVAGVGIGWLGVAASAGELTVASPQACEYQIVLPDEAPPVVAEALAAAANVLREMFLANGWTVPVVREGQAAAAKPGIHLGETRAARAAGLAPARLPLWAYEWKVVGRHVLIAGRDWPAPTKSKRGTARCSLGTVKGLTDFMHRFCGTRFLAPRGLTGIEFLPVKRIVVPADLSLRKIPMVTHNGVAATDDTGGTALFQSKVTAEHGGHTHELVIPAETYAATHPEYFALVGGRRIREYKHAWKGMVKEPHLCYSNPDVQELIYQDMLRSFDAGYLEYASMQADGFQPCQCEACRRMFDTDDWGEKLWLLNKRWAERLLKDRPGKILVVGAYTVTGKPPASFKEFPPNLRVSLRATESAFKQWSGHSVPAGFSSYLHAWGGYHLCGYLPVRTPLFAEKVVRLLAANHVRGVGLDGPPANMWGLEGPTAYVYARLFDDVEGLSAQKLVEEYLQAAYANAAAPMTRFFEVLHHTLEVYAEVFGVDNGTFQSYRRADGRRTRYLTSEGKLRLIAFLYPPETLDLLESHLAQAERAAGLGPKHKTRLALARREFEYLKSTARVVHLYNAYGTRRDRATLGPLLDEMEAREKLIVSWFDTSRERPVQKPIAPDWPMYVGGAGHYISHLTKNGGSYLSKPVPPFTWNVAKMRQAPLLAGQTLLATRIPAPWALAAPEWANVPGARLGPASLGGPAPERATTVWAVYDNRALYLRFEGELPGGWSKPAGARADTEQIAAGECFEAVLAPENSAARYFRFAGGPAPALRYDARHGFVEDSIDPRFDQDDPGWNAAWDYACAVAGDGKHWQALLSIPFRSLGTAAPASGMEWKANFGRVHQPKPDSRTRERALWSANPGTTSIGDREAFGTLRFE